MIVIYIKTSAKINISLDILGKRQNGYHDVCMIMQEISLYDEMWIEKSHEMQLKCNLPYIPCNDKNIVYKAAKAFFEYTKINGNVKIKLNKHIPVGAGLGGGSSNAAGVLTTLNKMYNTELTKPQLIDIGSSLGADVPFFIIGGTCLAEGIGEILNPINSKLKGFVVLAKPHFPVSTKWVYENLNLDDISTHPNTKLIINAIENGELNTVAQNMQNVLELVTAKRYKDIEEYKKIMRNSNALGSLMSGSGSTVFGLFDDCKKANYCSKIIKKYTPDVFVTKLL